MAKRVRSSQPEMIHCPYCGEDYSSTYKHCPFCDEVEQPVVEEDLDESGEGSRSRGGKRLATNTRGGGYGRGPSPLSIITRVISLGLIIAAVIIVITIIMPLVSKGNVGGPGENSAPAQTESVSPDPNETGTVDETTPPATEEPGTETIPAEQTATGFSLSQTEFSFSNTYPYPVTLQVTFTPAGTTGTITWTSSNPDIASVDDSGVVYHGTQTGTATITASMPGAADVTVTVYNSATSSEGLAPSGTGTGSGSGTTSASLSLNHTDFTFSGMDNPSVQMQVSGTSSTPTWSVSDTSVATISADGVVRPAGPGTATITCTVDGQALTCIVRCNF